MGLAGAALAACGHKGPPLAPLRPVPLAPANVTLTRVGDVVTIHLTLPTANTDRSEPLALDRVAVYAMTVAAGAPPPTRSALINPRHLAADAAVRPAPDPNAPDTSDEPETDTRPAPGDAIALTESLTPALLAPDPAAPKLPPARTGGRGSQAPISTEPTRYYVVVASASHRLGPDSGLLALPLVAAPAAPDGVTVGYDETTLTVKWTGQRDGQYRVYASDRAGHVREDGLLTPAALATASFAEPVKFGEEQCFVVRAAAVTGAVAVESAATPPACETPADTFPPPVPTGLSSAPAPGSITILWTAVAADDLRGYIVLRGEVPASGQPERLTNLTRDSPVTQTFFADSSVQPGVQYTYYVEAVDRAGNVSARSEGVVVTAIRGSGN